MIVATKQISKILFKKLSALRATLSDDERALLDTILLSQANTKNMANNHEEGVTEETEFDSYRQTGKPDKNKSTFHVRFDHEQEIYIVE